MAVIDDVLARVNADMDAALGWLFEVMKLTLISTDPA